MTGLPAALGVLRASQWLHFAVLPLAGLDRAALASPPALARGALAVAAASFALAYAYGINALADRESDASPAKNPLAGSVRAPVQARLAVAVVAVAALASSLSLGLAATLLMLASLLAGTLYSVGPRMKALPILGALFNTAIFTPLLGLAVPEAGAPPAHAALCVTFIGLILQNQLLHEAADAVEDAAGGAFTTARLLGPRGTRGLAAGLSAPFAALALALAPRPALGWTAAAALAGGAAAALSGRSFAGARRLHRRVAAAGGALLYGVGLFA